MGVVGSVIGYTAWIAGVEADAAVVLIAGGCERGGQFESGGVAIIGTENSDCGGAVIGRISGEYDGGVNAGCAERQTYRGRCAVAG